MPVCSICNEARDVVANTRCGECDPLRLKLQRILAKLPPDQRSAFDNWGTKENRADFYKKHKDTLRKDLKTEVEGIVKEKSTAEAEVAFGGNGNWMDEEDLREKYKHKPGRADAILENSRSYTCPIINVKLYEDMEYKSSFNNRIAQSETTEKSGIQKYFVKAAPKQKPVREAAQAACASDATDDKEFSANEVEKLKDMKTTMTNWVTLLEENIETGEGEIAEFLPPYMAPKLKTCLSTIKCEMVEIDIASEAGKGNMKEIKRKFQNAKPIDMVKKFRASCKGAAEELAASRS